VRELPVTRLSGIPPTIFGEMSALAAATGAINLGQGFPDEDGPAAVLARAAEALGNGANQYPPPFGIPALRRAVADHQFRHYGIELDPDSQVLVTTGATEAVAAAMLALVEPGDEVVVFEPYYDSYAAMIRMSGGVRRTVTLAAPGFRLDVDALRAAITPRTRVLLLNTPHNPTGTVLDQDELAAIATVAVEHDLVIVSDEVYEHLTFGAAHVPIATLPGMAERTVTISSLGKSYSLTGWKVGWATGPERLVRAVHSAKQWLTYVSGAPLQPAAAFALDELPDWPAGLAVELRRKRDLLCAGLASAGLRPSVPQGTYFAMTDVAVLGWDDGDAFCRELPHRAGVVAIPVRGFYDSDAGRTLVRWAFCKRDAVLTEATDRLAAADLRPGRPARP